MPKCGDIMTPNPECCGPRTTIEAVAKLMRDKDLGPIPIVDDKKHRRLVGIITDRDVAVKVVGIGKNAKTTTVDEVMTPAPLKCHKDDDIEEALRLMEEARVRRIPIVDRTNKVVGIVTQADIAVRLHKNKKTGAVVEAISRPFGM